VKKVDRYVLSEFLQPLALVVLGLAVLILLVQMVDQLPHLRSYKPSLSQELSFYLFQFPYFVTQVLPVGVMLATLIGLGGLARNSELTALSAGGVSRARVALPVLLAALAISGALLLVSETLVPGASARARYIQKVQIEKRDVDYDQFWRDHMAKNLPGRRQLYTVNFDAKNGTMQALVVMAYDANGALQRRLDAAGAHWAQDTRWVLSKGVERVFDAAGRETSTRYFESWPEDLGASPSDFMVDSDKREEDLMQLNIAQLDAIIARLRTTGGDARREQVCRALRISYPFSCFILALLGVGLPYLFPTGKRALTGAAMGLVASLVCGMLYLVFIQVGFSLGTSSHLPVTLSAWLGNLVFGALGLGVLWRVNS
jgi:lipopolysaccharide export system permease protein